MNALVATVVAQRIARAAPRQILESHAGRDARR
jgi:hypothetical protein